MTPDDLATLHARAMNVPAPWKAQDFEELLNSPGVFLVANGGGEGPFFEGFESSPTLVPESISQSNEAYLGFALGRQVLDEAELLTLVVDPEARRAGLGRECLAAFETESARRGAKRGFLEVAATNMAARALYLGSGWSENGRRGGYFQSSDGRIDAILMCKRLFNA